MGDLKMRKRTYWPPIVERNRWEQEKDARDDAEAARAQAENREPSLTEMLAKNRCIAAAFRIRVESGMRKKSEIRNPKSE